jgi:CRP-like cAMP-binding protein
MATADELAAELGSLTLFSDLSRPELEAIAHTFDEAWFSDGQRVLREGFTGTGFYVILDGEVSVVVGGEERARLGRGDFFGEISILLGEAPVADITAQRPLRCLHLAGPQLTDVLVAHPLVMLRMLREQTRRLRNANLWQR